MSDWYRLLLGAALIGWVLLVVGVAWSWQRREAERMQGYREWLEGRRLP